MFRRRIGAELGKSVMGSRGRNGDEATVAGLGRCQHRRNRGPCDVEHSGEVDLDHGSPHIVGRLPDGCATGDGSGRGDHRVDTPEAFEHRLDDGGNGDVVADVGRPGVAPPDARSGGKVEIGAGGGNVGTGNGSDATRSFGGNVDQGNGVSPQREPGGGGCANAAGRAGDDGDRCVTFRL